MLQQQQPAAAAMADGVREEGGRGGSALAATSAVDGRRRVVDLLALASQVLPVFVSFYSSVHARVGSRRSIARSCAACAPSSLITLISGALHQMAGRVGRSVPSSRPVAAGCDKRESDEDVGKREEGERDRRGKESSRGRRRRLRLLRSNLLLLLLMLLMMTRRMTEAEAQRSE